MLFGAVANKRVANAYLFIGPDEGAMRATAQAFASLLNCEKPKEDSCGNCGPCGKIERGIHPDVLTISPEGASTKISQIRDLISYTRFGPSEGAFKVCIIDDAASMTGEAANSFLKTLEEPAQNIVFLLLAASDVGIPQTVLSRCQKIVFSEPADQAEQYEDVEWVYDELLKISRHDVNAMLRLSSRIVEHGDDAAGMLEVLMSRLWREDTSSRSSRLVGIVLQALSAIKKRANTKLALDVMCLKLGEAINV
jgi:DNA polymerase III gamma/tau subunit